MPLGQITVARVAKGSTCEPATDEKHTPCIRPTQSLICCSAIKNKSQHSKNIAWRALGNSAQDSLEYGHLGLWYKSKVFNVIEKAISPCM